MFDRELVISTRDRALEQAPDVLNPVRMNVPTDILFGSMVDDLMLCILVPDPAIGLVVIRDNEWSLRDLSGVIGISAATLMRVEMGHVPDGNTLRSILAYLLHEDKHGETTGAPK